MKHMGKMFFAMVYVFSWITATSALNNKSASLKTWWQLETHLILKIKFNLNCIEALWRFYVAFYFHEFISTAEPL